jgi:UDP-N-acetylglucosamine 2-epimerase (non-hydrolysing)
MKILHVVGARPNYMKVAPIMAEMGAHPHQFQQVLVHTGQHYDRNMSDCFFEQLAMPEPDEFLGIGSGTHAQQTARVMLAFEPLLAKHRPDWVFVVGDVNSTLACALVCAKLGIPLAHVEAGLRSRDMTMPEEINRLLTDQIADLLFTPSRDADENLRREGIAPDRIHFVGNVMIDSLIRMLPAAQRLAVLSEFGLRPREYVLATFHRPSNVDDPDELHELLSALKAISSEFSVVFPVHPRTRQKMASLGNDFSGNGLRLLEPLGYLEFLALMNSAALVLTDSGGVQEETTFLGVPCVTVRPSTERPVTILEGTNRLVPNNCAAIASAFTEAISMPGRSGERPELWDGSTATRIVEVMLALQGSKAQQAPLGQTQ